MPTLDCMALQSDTHHSNALVTRAGTAATQSETSSVIPGNSQTIMSTSQQSTANLKPNITQAETSSTSYGPNSIWLVSTRLDTTRHVRLCRASRDDRVERVEPCCSNMADDEQAIVLACTSLVVFMLLHTQILFVSSNKIN